MTDSTLETVLRRDRAIVATSLAAVTALAWFYILWLVHAMHAAGMGGVTAALGAAMHAAPRAWSNADFVAMFVMWSVMMVGMMTPSATPMILLYARVGRQAAARGRPLAATGFFAGGYLLAWTVFSLAATIGQWALSHSLLLTPMMSSASGMFSGLVLVAVGVFQLTPLKEACLRHCRAPLQFIQHHGGFRRDPRGSLAIGFRHGLYCVGCCWALMCLLFVGGVMNLLWIAMISIFVLAEKLVRSGGWLPRTTGGMLVAGGLWVLGASIA